MSQIQNNLFWDSTNKSLILGPSGSYTNPLSADAMISASQNISSGIFPLKLTLNQGNFFVLTKDGKISINTSSLPIYESSPNFHMVGRCAVFEGTCGAGGVALTLYNNPDVVPQVGSIGGTVNLSARNNNRNVVNFAQIQSKILNPNKPVSSGQFLVNVDVSGSAQNILKLDHSVNQLGINDATGVERSTILGSSNSIDSLTNSKIFGDYNSVNNANQLYLIGSNNSVDLIQNNVRYIFGNEVAEQNITDPNLLSGLDWPSSFDLMPGDIVKVENNNLLNGYYIALNTKWTLIDDSVAVGYIGTSNLLFGSNDSLSGNNVIVVGNESTVTGNNISMFGSYNNIKTAKLSDIISNTSVLANDCTVVGAYNSIDASGIIIFGNHNTASGVSAIYLNGSDNIAASGSINSILIGNSNNITSISGIALGSNNLGTINYGSVFGNDNIFTVSTGIINGHLINASGFYNNIAGLNIRVSGNYNTVFGSRDNLIGSSGVIVGLSNSIVGDTSVLLGNSISSSGRHNVILGNTVAVSGESNIVLGSRISHSGGLLSNTLVEGNNNSLIGGSYDRLSMLGNFNVVNSGIKNVTIIGQNNTHTNTFSFAVPYIAGSVVGSRTITVPIASSDYFRINDTVSLIKNIVGTNVTITRIISNIIYVDGDSIKTIQFTEDMPAEFSASVQISAKSLTFEADNIYYNSNPNISIGNFNTQIGMSGLSIGNLNYSSGIGIFNVSHNSELSGNHIINIGNKIHLHETNNVVNIGSDSEGSLNSSVNVGFSNTLYGSGHNIVGHDNLSISGQTFGNTNTILEQGVSVVGKDNIVIGNGSQSNTYGAYNPALIELNDIISSGIFAVNDALVVVSSSSGNKPISIKEQFFIQFIENDRYVLPPYTGICTYVADQSVAFDNKMGRPAGDTDPVINSVSLLSYLNLVFSNNIPSDLKCLICRVHSGNKYILGDNNVLIAPKQAFVVGQDNTIGVDLNWAENVQNSQIAPSSGLIVGAGNLLTNTLEIIENGQGVPQSYNPKYPNLGFQGAIGFDILNNSPNSIHFGYGTNTIKVFDKGGTREASVIEVVDETTTPPTSGTVLKEKVGNNTFERGIVFNPNYDKKTVVAVAGSSAIAEPVLTVIPSGQGYVGINNSKPAANLDVSGSFAADSVSSDKVTTKSFVLSSGAQKDYYLMSKDAEGNAEWVSGIKVDMTGVPKSILYWEASAPDNGKVRAAAQTRQTTINTQNVTVPYSYVKYDPSGLVVSRSGVVFDQWLSIDKYAVMSLDEHKRATIANPLSGSNFQSFDNTDDITAGLSMLKTYSQQLTLNAGQDDARLIPKFGNVLYMIPEQAGKSVPIDADATVDKTAGSSYKTTLSYAGQNRESMFVIGRRDEALSFRQYTINGEDLSTNPTLASIFPGGLSAPQTIISNIPKKGSKTFKSIGYRFNIDEMYSPHLAPFGYDENTPFDSDHPEYQFLKPLVTQEGYKGWWDGATVPNKSDVTRSIPTAFNAGLQDIDFVIYGTGSKYPDDRMPKFLFGSVQDYMDNIEDTSSIKSTLPCIAETPAFYFNSSISSFMIHTMRPSWIPTKIPADICEPCDPKQSGISFADLTIRGWIGTSGIRIGQGFKRAYTTNADGNLVEAVDAKGQPIYDSTLGMVLKSDKYGFAVWSDVASSVASLNDVIPAPSTTTQTSSETVLTEGSLDPISSVANYPMEDAGTKNSAILYRNTVNINSEADIVTSNPSLKLKGVTRNSLLFAHNPFSNSNSDSAAFNDTSYPSNTNEMNVDGTENLFYYGYANALAGVLDYNSSLQKTIIQVDGDATRRVNIGDTLRIVITYLNLNNNVDVTLIKKVKVLGVNTLFLYTPSSTGKNVQTTIVLDQAIPEVDTASYSLAASSKYRNVAFMSENIGGYMTFNFPGNAPENVLSNRAGIDNKFNFSGKNIDFNVYGMYKTDAIPTLSIDSLSEKVSIKSDRPEQYGSYVRTIDIVNANELKKDITSDIYYDFGWKTSIIGTLSGENIIKCSSSLANEVLVGDVIEVTYDSNQKINAKVLKIYGTPEKNIELSFNSVNIGMVGNSIGNISRNEKTGTIENTNIKFRIIKRELNIDYAQNKASGVIPLYADLTVKGLTYTAGLMLGDKDANNNMVVPNKSVLYNRYGVILGSELRFFEYNDLIETNAVHSHLLFKAQIPSVIGLGDCISYKDKNNPNIIIKHKKPILADTTLGGTVKVANLHVDHLNSFDTIDAGVVVFRGSCDRNELKCTEDKPDPVGCN